VSGPKSSKTVDNVDAKTEKKLKAPPDGAAEQKRADSTLTDQPLDEVLAVSLLKVRITEGFQSEE
jgi:hypothetical protein